MAYALRRFGRGRIPIKDKIEAIAARFDGRTTEEVVKAICEKNGLPMPAKPSVILAAWRMAVNNAISSGDTRVLELCQDCNLLVEIPDPPPAPPAGSLKRAQRKTSLIKET